MSDLTIEGQENYAKYRGKCKEMSEAAVAADPTLSLVRGYYYCPFWGEQTHWWTVQTDGTIFDPTALQFPSRGIGHYEAIPFGVIRCEQCGKEVAEAEATMHGHHAFCSGDCLYRCVM